MDKEMATAGILLYLNDYQVNFNLESFLNVIFCTLSNQPFNVFKYRWFLQSFSFIIFTGALLFPSRIYVCLPADCQNSKPTHCR